jgi:hypothetical protein
MLYLDKRLIILICISIACRHLWIQNVEIYHQQKNTKSKQYDSFRNKQRKTNELKTNSPFLAFNTPSGKKEKQNFASSLSEALVKVQDPVFILYGNKGYKSIMGNFVCNMALYPPIHKHILMVVTDNTTALFLQTLSEDITLYVSQGEQNLHDAYNFESPEYLKLMLARGWMLVDLLREAVVQKRTVIWLEPDFYYTQNLLNRTEMMETVSDLVLFWDQEMYCGCFIRFAPVQASVLFYKEVMQRMQAIHSKGGTTNDQILLNAVVADQLPNFTLFDRCLYRSGTFNTGGYMLEYQLSCLGIQPVAQHHNWIVGAGTKVQMAKEKGGWFMTEDEQRCKTNVTHQGLESFT